MARSKKKRRRRAYTRSSNVLTLPTPGSIDAQIDSMVFGGQKFDHLSTEEFEDMVDYFDGDPTNIPDDSDFSDTSVALQTQFVPLKWAAWQPQIVRDIAVAKDPASKFDKKKRRKAVAAAAVAATALMSSVCVERKTRTEVMFATKKAGKKGQRSPVWTSKSKERC